MSQTTTITPRKQKILAIVNKSNSAFLKRVVSDRNGFDADIRIAAHLELERRS